MIPIVPATFVSVWDGGYRVETPCEVNLKTKEVCHIIPSTDPNIESLDILDRELVQIGDEEFPVYRSEDDAFVPDMYFYRN